MRGESPRTHRIKLRDSTGRVTGEKEVVSFRGLLEMVHRERLRETTTELVQAPTKENGETAIVRATVRTTKGTFSGIGDANPRNVAPHIAPHIIRMAETRALARAMRVATGCGETALEELDGSFDEVPRPEERRERSKSERTHTPTEEAPRAARRERGSEGGDSNGASTSSGQHTPASENQVRFLYRLLAQTGRTGEAAHAFVHKALRVESLEAAPKHAVSALIDSLKSELENGGPSDERPRRARTNGAANGNGRYDEPGMNG
jgi:hypothetical protein